MPALKRYITILPDIMVMTLDGKGPLYFEASESDKKPEDRKGIPSTHRNFLRDRSGDGAFGVGHANVFSAEDIRKAIGDCAPGDVVVLEDADWERLVKAVKMPTVMIEGKLVEVGYNPTAAPQIAAFIRSVLGAAIEDPRKKVDEG